ncbi:lantibiotic dehydratase [Haliangium sp.]|uniref:lantibiotic dehydratase n=1 Tax=Haliangium sp. TaxID=2663208 RepID=UPI003D0CDD60
MSRGRPDPMLRPDPRFVLRTPLLPVDAFEAWSAAASGCDDDSCERLRAGLREALAQPAVREALFVASPGLDDSLAYWLEQPDTPRGQKVERALVRYFARMATRATPFGLFSGVSVGRVGERTQLRIAAREGYGRSTRLDNDYLFALASALHADPAIRTALRWRPNSSLYELSGHLRYAEARLHGKLRTYHLVGVESADYIEATLTRARTGAELDSLARALVADDPEIELAEAEAFVHELVDSQLLVCELEPAVTGKEPIEGMLEVLAEAAPGSPAHAGLAEAAARLAALDRQGVGAPSTAYHEVAAGLASLPAELELARLFQVDLVKPAPEAVLGAEVIAELGRGIELLRRLTPAHSGGAVRDFRNAFRDRYEDREVPLVEALDEDLGVGFDVRGGAEAGGAPLLADLRLPAGSSDDRQRWLGLHRHLLRKLEDAWRRGAHELVLSEADIDAMAAAEPTDLAPALGAVAVVVGADADAIARGDFQVHLRSAGGPSGARLLGRFCHASDEIHELVRGHLRAEEALRPQAVFAEIVHLNEGRMGNVLCRPVLRDYEIPYLGVSGAARERQIPLQDLLVSVRGDRVVLRSRRLGLEVVPRMSTAHNFQLRTVGVYRFLCALQSQDGGSVSWTWGPLEGARFLPRVRCGKTIFSRAMWRLDEADLAPLAQAVRTAKKASTPAAVRAGRARVFEAAQSLRAACALPRLVLLVDNDNELTVDLDNPLSVDSFAWLVHRRPAVVLTEPYAGPDAHAVRGPEGRFAHELVLTFTRAAGPAQAPAPAQASAAETEAAAPTPPVPAVQRTFPPGSEWLYVKLYTGLSTADEVLRRVIAPVRTLALDSGAADRWFFLRFSDPDHHLRVRFHGPPARLMGEVMPALHEAAAPLMADRGIWRIQLDTYQREVERYGRHAIELCELVFWHDSEAVLDIVELLEGDEGADARWRLGLRGADMLLDDLGLSAEVKFDLALSARDSFRHEFNADTAVYKQIGEIFRRERAALFAMLARDPEHDRDSDLEPGFEAFARRSAGLVGVCTEMGARDRAGQLSPPLARVAWSHVHMHLNRLLHTGQRTQELVLYDLLHRWYASRRARRGGQKERLT